MMNRLLILNLIFCSIVLAQNVAKKNYYLEKICKNEAFDFEDKKVNAFYRIDFEYSLRNLTELLLPVDLKFDTWTDNERDLLIANKNQYNKLMEDFYNRQSIDLIDSSIVHLYKRAILKIWNLFSSYKNKIGFGESSSFYTIDSTIKAAAEFLHDIMSLKSNLLAPNLIKENDLKFVLLELKEQMKFPIQETIVFEDHAFHFYYNKRILKMIRFDFQPNSSKALFEILVPISTENANQMNCRTVKSLPPFFNQL